MDQFPLVTIAALNYNNERFVIEALESIKAQTYPNIELLISDDCSTDNGLQLIKDWLKSYDKPHELIEHPVNLGIVPTSEELYNRANGKYFCYLATDDAFLPYKIQEQVDILESHDGEYAMVYGDAIIINENSEILSKTLNDPERWERDDYIPPSGDIFLDVIKGIFFYFQSALLKLDALRDTQFHFDENVMADDYNLELIMSRNYKIYGSKKPYIKYRRVETSFSTVYVKSDKIHKLYKSLFHMFAKYLNHPLNTVEENKVILNRMRGFIWDLEHTQGFGQKDRVKYFYKMFRNSLSGKDSYLFLRSVASYVFRLQWLKKDNMHEIA